MINFQAANEERRENVLVRTVSSALLGIDKCITDIDNAFCSLTKTYQIVIFELAFSVTRK